MPNKKEIRTKTFNAEKALWSVLKNRELCGAKFIRRYSLDKYTIDFFSPDKNLAIELDAENFKTKNGYDVAREKYILSKGIKICRISHQQVKNCFIRFIKAILHQHTIYK